MKVTFDCVFYYVSDMERSIRFYQDILGFRLISRDVVARFDVDGVLIELVPAPDESALRGAGNARLCLRADDVEQALKALRAKGARTGQEQRKSAGVLGTVDDPDGNEICLWQYL
ncbi:MAG: VOC family protein [Acidobacteriia bacterium]|nr:VOC family protein [Terriglobia bacterium]